MISTGSRRSISTRSCSCPRRARRWWLTPCLRTNVEDSLSGFTPARTAISTIASFPLNRTNRLSISSCSVKSFSVWKTTPPSRSCWRLLLKNPFRTRSHLSSRRRRDRVHSSQCFRDSLLWARATKLWKSLCMSTSVGLSRCWTSPRSKEHMKT